MPISPRALTASEKVILGYELYLRMGGSRSRGWGSLDQNTRSFYMKLAVAAVPAVVKVLNDRESRPAYEPS